MTSHDSASDSALAALMATSDPAVSSMSSESAVSKLRESYLIEQSRRLEFMSEVDKVKLAESMRRDVLGVYNALLNNDRTRLLLFCASLCAKIELSQYEWAEHNSSVADNCELVLAINTHVPSLSFQIRPARRSLINGVTVRHADFPSSADNTIEGREAILDQLVTSGLRQRLMRWYTPYRRQRLTGSSVDEVVRMSGYLLTRGDILRCVQRLVFDHIIDHVSLSSTEIITSGVPQWTTQQLSTSCHH